MKLLLLALALVVVAAAPVRADDAPADEASAHFEAGVALVKRGNNEGALAEFEAAYRLVPSWEYLFNIGVTQKALDRYGAAIRTLDRYLAEGGDQIDAERRRKVEAELTALRKLVAEVVITVDGAPATIEIDGVFEGITPLPAPVLLASGKHTIRASREGELADEQSIDVVSRETQEIHLEPRPAPVVPTTARISIATRPPGAHLIIDGELRVDAPWTGELVAGDHTITAELDGHQPGIKTIVVAAGQERPYTIDLAVLPPPVEGKPPLYRRPWFWLTVAAVGVAGTVGGIIYVSQPEVPDVPLHW